MVALNPPKTYWEKLKNFIDRKTIPSDLTIDDGIRYWQERLLLVFVFAGAILGFLFIFPASCSPSKKICGAYIPY